MSVSKDVVLEGVVVDDYTLTGADPVGPAFYLILRLFVEFRRVR